VLGGYVGWQIYQGQQLVNQYTADAQKLAQGASIGSALPNAQKPGSNKLAPQASAGPTSPSQTSQAPTSSSSDPQSPESQSDSSASSVKYKQLMSSTYQQTLQTMQNVKSNTLALQAKKLSLFSYRDSILQCQATFSSAEDFARANPPTEENLDSSYQEFLAGIDLAKQSMSVVLNGVSSLSPSNLYAARTMGKKAQQQVIEGYGGL